MRLLILKRELIIQQARNKPIPYTFCLYASALATKRVFHYIFKETFGEEKNQRKCKKGTSLFTKAKLHNAEHYNTNSIILL